MYIPAVGTLLNMSAKPNVPDFFNICAHRIKDVSHLCYLHINKKF